MSSALHTRLAELKKIEGLRDWTEEEDMEVDGLYQDLRVLILAAVPRPTCCTEAREWAPIVLRLGQKGGYDRDPDRAEWGISLEWDHITATDKRMRNAPTPKFCPYCATPLPKMVRKEDPPSPLCRNEDDYCGTCTERLDSCFCYPPTSAFEPES